MIFSEISHLRTAWLPGLFSLLIKVLSVSGHHLFILKFHCFMLLLNFITSKYSFFRRYLGIYQYFQICLVLRGSFLINISSTALVLKWGSIFSVINHKWLIYNPLNDFKLTGMVYCNHLPLLILVKDAKYIHFYPTFHLPPTLSHCKYKPFIKSIEFCLFRHKYWLKHLSAI